MAESYGRGTAVEPQRLKRSGDLPDAVQHLTTLGQRIDTATNRIGNALDRIHGSRPTETDSPKPPNGPVAVNSISELKDQLGRLSSLVNYLEHCAERLDSIG